MISTSVKVEVACTVPALVHFSIVEEFVHRLLALPPLERLVALRAYAFAFAFNLPRVGTSLNPVPADLTRLRPASGHHQHEAAHERRDTVGCIQRPEIDDSADNDEGEASSY